VLDLLLRSSSLAIVWIERTSLLVLLHPRAHARISASHPSKKEADGNVSPMAPAPSAAQQKGLVAEFTSIAPVDKTAAAKILKQHNWNLTAAVNA
jgi:hypothetical protein